MKKNPNYQIPFTKAESAPLTRPRALRFHRLGGLLPVLSLAFTGSLASASIWENSGWALIGDLAGSATYDSNVFATRDGEEDTVFAVQPMLTLKRKGSLSNIAISADANVRWFLDRTDQDSTDPSFLIDYSYPNTGEAIIRHRARLGWNRQSNPDYSVGNRIRRTELFGNWNGVLRDTGKTLVIAQLSANDTDYTDFRSDVLDYSGGIGLAWVRSPLLQYTFLANYERSEYSRVGGGVGDTTRDGYNFNIGVRGEFTPKITGEASVGAGRNEYSGLIEGSGTSWFTSVNVNWKPTARRSVGLNATRGTHFDALGTAYNRFETRLTFRQEFAGGFSGLLRAGLGESDYSESDIQRKDQFVRFGAGLEYSLTERFGAGLDFSWMDRTSDLARFEYDKHEISGRASWRF